MSSFIVRNKPDWDELEQLVRKARKSLRSLTAEELGRLDVLYRRTTIHLARAATRTSDRQLVAYLNGLTAAAHSLIYLPPRRSMFAGAVRFLYEGFARSIARNLRFHAVSAGLLLGGALLAYYLCTTDVMAAYALSMPGDPRQPGATREQLEAALRAHRDDGSGVKFFFASFLFQNNFKVGMTAMALGVLAGVPTILLMIYNGMILGWFVAVHHQAGITWEMWAWILPHGITEIGAIMLCGGVGLMLGRSVLRPGELSRGDSLRAAGVEAGRTCAGMGLMLVAAAIIESYVRQSHLSTAARLAFAAVTALFWALYIVHGALRERVAVRETQAASQAPHSA
jgi:uncharacterized membrane protein SpoIIM required for sporulation